MGNLLPESVEILLLRLTPLNLADCIHARQVHVLQMFRLLDELCPDIGLHTEDMMLSLLRNALERLVGIDFLDREIAADGKRLHIETVGLIIIEIGVGGRSHDRIETLLGSLDTAVDTSPGHHRSTLGKFSFKDLVPTDDGAAMLVEELLDACGHIVLKAGLCGSLAVGLETEFPDPGLAVRTLCPLGLRALVATDVDILGREYVNDLLENSLEELEGSLLAGTENLVGYSPMGPDLVRTAGATEFRIGGKGAEHVAREVDLRDDCDATL